jgi:hypothetical protein
MRYFVVALFVLLALPAAAQEAANKPVEVQQPAKVEDSGVEPAQPAEVEKKPVEAPKSASAAPVVQNKPKPNPPRKRLTELELSGNFGVDSKSFVARTRLDRSAEDHPWFIRTGYRMTKSYSGKGDNIKQTKITTTTLDSQIKSSNDQQYYYAGATANIRTRNPAGAYAPKSGYFMPSVGFGKSPNPDFSISLGAGFREDYEKDSTSPALILALRQRHKFTKTLSLDGNVFAIKAMDERLKLDSDIALSQQLNHFLFLRFGYSATNMVKRTTRDSEWDTIYRVTLLCRWTH